MVQCLYQCQMVMMMIEVDGEDYFHKRRHRFRHRDVIVVVVVVLHMSFPSYAIVLQNDDQDAMDEIDYTLSIVNCSSMLSEMQQ